MAFHLKINGQDKITNQKIEKHLRTYINQFKNNWVDLLPIAKFAANANSFFITQIPLF